MNVVSTEGTVWPILEQAHRTNTDDPLLVVHPRCEVDPDLLWAALESDRYAHGLAVVDPNMDMPWWRATSVESGWIHRVGTGDHGYPLTGVYLFKEGRHLVTAICRMLGRSEVDDDVAQALTYCADLGLNVKMWMAGGDPCCG